MRLSETLEQLALPPALKALLVVMQKQLRGKGDEQVGQSLRLLGGALLAIADGSTPNLALAIETDDGGAVTDLSALDLG